MVDYSGKGSNSVSGSRQPKLARAGVLENNYQAIEELFAPKPDKWEKMMKWYEKRGVTPEIYDMFIKDVIGVDAEADTITPEEVTKLITIGAKHSKNEDEFNDFKNKYGVEDKKDA